MHLLDVNLLIALAWPSHIHHVLAQSWFVQNRQKGWATCAITQIGFVRISSNPKFIDGAVSPKDAIRLLRKITKAQDHTFWETTFEVTNEAHMQHSHLLGPRQVTDAYLLSLAINQAGKLITLDGGIASLLPDADMRTKYLEILI